MGRLLSRLLLGMGATTDSIVMIGEGVVLSMSLV